MKKPVCQKGTIFAMYVLVYVFRVTWHHKELIFIL